MANVKKFLNELKTHGAPKLGKIEPEIKVPAKTNGRR
jgi:hypothetical protein